MYVYIFFFKFSPSRNFFSSISLSIYDLFIFFQFFSPLPSQIYCFYFLLNWTPIFSLVLFYTSIYLISLSLPSLSPPLAFVLFFFFSLFLLIYHVLYFYIPFSFAFINYFYTLSMFSLRPSTTIADSSERIEGFRRPGAQYITQTNIEYIIFLFKKIVQNGHNCTMKRSI